MILRPYQTRAVDSLRTAYAAGHRAPLLVLPTGGGKTPTAAAIIRMALAKGNRVLFAAGRLELLGQAIAKLADAGIRDVRVVISDAPERNANAAVTVASVPTLAARGNLPDAEFVVLDEAHHVKAETWSHVAAHYSKAKLLGLTATPARGDSKGLGDIFDSIVVGATVKELTDLGHLVPCQVFAPSRVMESREIALEPLEAYEKYCAGKPTLVFAQTKQHARSIAESFQQRGIRTATVFGDSPDRVITMPAFASGDLDVLVGVSVFIEGWDAPRAGAAIFARKFTHVGGYLQAIGRVLRPFEGKALATVVDLCGSALTHGTPDLDRQYSLDGKGIQSTRVPIRQCQACGGVFQDAQKCPHCGFAAPPLQRTDPKATGEGVSALAPKTPPRPWFVPMTAKFPGFCPSCQKRISKGDSIVWVKGQKPKHVECARQRRAA